ncbi:MAG: hypothetical protein AAGA78_07850 [Pseudomonadota bacterium]
MTQFQTPPKTLQEAQERARLERSKAFYDLARALRSLVWGKPASPAAKPLTA